MSPLESILSLLSKSLRWVAAFFFASLLLLTLPSLTKGFIEPVPAQFHWYVVGCAFLTGAYLAVGVLAYVAEGVVYGAGCFVRWMRRKPPTEPESFLLWHMGAEYPNAWLNVNHLGNGLSKLEWLQLCASLQRKGYLEANHHTRELVRLTDEGRSRAQLVMQSFTAAYEQQTLTESDPTK